MNRPLVVKIAIIAALALLLIVPLRVISDLVAERRGLRDQVVHDIAQTSTGTQRFEGIALVIPCTDSYEETETLDNGRSVVRQRSRSCDQRYLPETLTLDAAIDTEFRHRGIYRALLHRSKLEIAGEFRIRPAPPFEKARRQYEAPHVSIGIGEIRGVRETPTLVWNGETHALRAGSGKAPWARGIHAQVPVDLQREQTIAFRLQLDLVGLERLEIVPGAGVVQARLKSAWPHPSFFGRSLPDKRSIDAHGFDALWHTSDLSTNVRQAFERCVPGKCEEYAGSAFGVAFVQTVDIYQQTYRAARYGMLFVALTFAVFFLYEVLTGLRVHPIQYALVGVALATFFVLLLALSEHLAFAHAYLAAALGCIGLIVIYVRYVLGSWTRAGALGGLLAALYASLYVVLGSEDYALLMGALLLFVALGAFMLLTRRLDWYALPGQARRAETAV
jgi:inner membrane protein